MKSLVLVFLLCLVVIILLKIVELGEEFRPCLLLETRDFIKYAYVRLILFYVELVLDLVKQYLLLLRKKATSLEQLDRIAEEFARVQFLHRFVDIEQSAFSFLYVRAYDLGVFNRFCLTNSLAYRILLLLQLIELILTEA